MTETQEVTAAQSAFDARVTMFGYADPTASPEAIRAAALVVDEYAAHTENVTRAAVAQVTGTVAYGSVTRHADGDQTYAPCNGINHTDGGEVVTHDRCGADVVRRDDGRIYDVVLAGSYAARKMQCWRGVHECKPARVAEVAARRAQADADGEVVKGADVVVARGRKVPKGTTGRVFWTGEDAFGTAKVGLVTESGVKHFTAAKNCDRV